MIACQEAVAEQGLGLRGDHHARSASARQVLLADSEDLDELELLPGTIKENLTVEGLRVMRLEPGTRLRVGSALLELTSVCEPCFRMDEIRAGLKQALEGRRGMNSRVLQGGLIRVGDPIAVVRTEAVLG
jgi:MOSC domain-containing protein YiiM